MFEQMRRSEVMVWALSPVRRTLLDSSVEDCNRRRDRYECSLGRFGQLKWKRVWLALLAFFAVPAVVFGTRGVLIALLAAVVLVVLARVRGWSAGRYLRQCLRAGWLYLRWGFARLRLGVDAWRWGERVERAIEPAVSRVTRDLLGDDPDSLLVSDSFDGLRSPRDRGYWVDNAAARTLERKLGQIESGTIAVCGPRGAGKSTLLETSVARAGFGLLAQAPASYTPHDFLLSLSVDLCKEYIRYRGHAVPPLVQLSPVKRLLRRIRSQTVRSLKWAAFALPAAAAVVLGVGAAVRANVKEHGLPLAEAVRRVAEERFAEAAGIWQGHAAAGTGVTIAVLGVAWWRARHSEWISDAARSAWRAVASVAGLVLITAALVGLIRDVSVARHLEAAIAAVALPVVAFGGLWTVLFSASALTPEFQIGHLRVRPRGLLGFIAGLTGWAGLLYCLHTPQTQAVLAAPGNAVRLVELTAGMGLLHVRHWTPRPAEPPLVTRCRNHLIRLQTQQSSSAALTTGTSQFLALGTSHMTSVATIPPNFPAVVQEFKELLARIAVEFKVRGETVVIAIDELDRLGTDTQTLAFLAEIKAVLGVEHVHYILAVAEDVGAAFVRRGLPHRDVTDSSLDDIVYVQPATLAESRTMLDKRAELTGPYAVLTHAMAGGIPRDLIRYGRRVMDMKDKTRSGEMVRIARQLIFEELFETLAGFRTILSKQHWTQGTGNILGSFRVLVGLLREPCPCTETELHQALVEFAFYAIGDTTSAPIDGELAQEARQLIDEASAYAYFSLTLLDIFAREGLERRSRQAADHGPDGYPERLAEARQELAVSPYSSRPLIDAIRKAWSLPMGPAGNSIRLPRQGHCPLHHP
ncbi:P-loop NTPase fold protein [Streptomyces sp. JV176]|nr:P-loop NTPase fold protein [Streptomyces sp. JV176]